MKRAGYIAAGFLIVVLAYHAALLPMNVGNFFDHVPIRAFGAFEATTGNEGKPIFPSVPGRRIKIVSLD